MVRLTRTIPASIPKQKIVASSVEKLDPGKQLREAGYPFNHISTELELLHGRWEVVSGDVVLLKDTIAGEAQKLSAKVDDSQKSVLEKVESLFDRKFMAATGKIIAAGTLMYAAAGFLQGQGLGKNAVSAVAAVAGISLWLFVNYFFNRNTK